MIEKPQIKRHQQNTSKKAVKLKSFSKLNLGLWIKEKRPDGYHEIETIFYENKDLYDDVQIKFFENKKLNIDVSFLQEELNTSVSKYENLAYKAALLFFEESGFSGNCNITINKNIPLQAGLGGGSSNAASVLKGLNQIFANKLHEEELMTLGAKIGSDVLFFLIGGTCLGKGRGENLSRLENNLKINIKIVKLENISISTKWAYEQIDAREFIAEHKKEISNLILAMKVKDYDLFFKNIFNDFEMVAFSYYPELIVERKKMLEEGYKTVNLCGSGAALFGIR